LREYASSKIFTVANTLKMEDATNAKINIIFHQI
jgi:hypothetical protein